MEIIKTNLSMKKISRLDRFITKFEQTFKEDLTTMLLKLSHKRRKGRKAITLTLRNQLYCDTKTL